MQHTDGLWCPVYYVGCSSLWHMFKLFTAIILILLFYGVILSVHMKHTIMSRSKGTFTEDFKRGFSTESKVRAGIDQLCVHYVTVTHWGDASEKSKTLYEGFKPFSVTSTVTVGPTTLL